MPGTKAITGLAASDEFDGNPLTTITYKGQSSWIASEIGRALGYTDRSLVSRITGEWSKEMVEGKEYCILRDKELVEFKELFEAVTPDVTASPFSVTAYPPFSSYTSHLMLLFQPGIWVVCLKTDKPAGVRLRRFLVDEVLPQISHDGAYLPDRKVVDGKLVAAPTSQSRGIEKADLQSIVEVVTKTMVTVLDSWWKSHAPMVTESTGVIGLGGGSYIRSELQEYARLFACGNKKKQKSIRSAVDLDLRTVLSHFGTARGWDDLPATKWPDVRARLESMRREAMRLCPDRQLFLFGGNTSVIQ